jgi:NUMOD3 motif-containing protein
MKTFYTYMWLREDGTPYYVGKGKDNRAFRKGSPPAERILLQDYPDEAAALAAEKFLIAFYGRKDQGTGCLRNLTDGGDGLPNPSPEVRQKMRDSHVGQVPWTKGKKMSAEYCQKLSEAHKGQIPWTAGGHHSEETRHKISESHKGKTFISPEKYKEMGEARRGENNHFFGKRHSEDSIRKLSASLKGRKAWNKGVPCSEEKKAALSVFWKGKPWSQKRRAACGKSTSIAERNS